MRALRAVPPRLLLLLLCLGLSHALLPAVPSSESDADDDVINSSSPFCADFFAAHCRPDAEDSRAAWLARILAENRDAEDPIKAEYEAARRALSIVDGADPEAQPGLTLGTDEASKEQIEAAIKKECADFACLAKYYEPLYTFFYVYAEGYEGKTDAGKRAWRALEYMNRFKNDEDAAGFAARIHMVATTANRARLHGNMKSSMLYNVLLERSYVHKYRLKEEASSGIRFADIKKIVDEVPKKIAEELEKTAAGEPQVELLGLSYIDILREEWGKMKAPEDDNIEEALGFYREAYGEGKKLWKQFGPHTAAILAHVSALHALREKDPNDILDLISSDPNYDNKRFMREINKKDRLILPESFLVESVYRTGDRNMGILAFRLAKIMLRRAFEETGQDLVKHMQDDIKQCTQLQFQETFRKLYAKNHTTNRHAGKDIYFMEAVQAALRAINKNGYQKEVVADFYKRLAAEYCHDARNGVYLINGAARFFKPFTDAFGCTAADPLHFVESNCLPLGSSNVHRRASEL